MLIAGAIQTTFHINGVWLHPPYSRVGHDTHALVRGTTTSKGQPAEEEADFYAYTNFWNLVYYEHQGLTLPQATHLFLHINADIHLVHIPALSLAASFS